MAKYIITGEDRAGRRFKPIHTNTPWNYNIWKGTVWEALEGGKRKKVKTIWNG